MTTEQKMIVIGGENDLNERFPRSNDKIQEELADYFSEGFRIKQISSCSPDNGDWLCFVVLEREISE